ncbi:hypothetical protein BCON_0285g00060 [Botryotinia convoluta]|uniref:Uncharacterized protein n=1 Tax=Botryotinia convoluta TaxID=54673 RepID=A0A4Z1HJ66_9HELO|nr:hypothetical protein BCON_0285g00060 [Botryotinia convoluta]
MANVNHQPGMANAATQREVAFRIFLQPQRPIDIRADEMCGSFDSPQKPPLSGNHTIVNAGAISRQGIFAWVRGILNELQSFNLHSINLVPALWGQLFKIIQNHSFFKRWIFSRPRPGPMGFLTFIHDPSEEQKYTADNVHGRAQIIWQEIEADLKDEEPNQFIGEIFQQVFHIWQYKCCMNNMLMDLRGHPRTTERDAVIEFMRYRLPRHAPPYPNYPAPAHQPAHPPQNPAGADTGIVGHASIIGNPGNNPTHGATNTRTGARLSTGMSLAAGSLEISDNQSSGQSDNTNPALNQPYAPMPTSDHNTGRMVSTLMVSGTALAHGLRRGSRIVSSAMPNVVQAGGSDTVQAGGSNVPAASVPQNNGNQQNGNAQGNRQPRPGPGAAMGQSRPPQPNLRRRPSMTRTPRTPRTPHVPQFNSAIPGSSAAGPAVTQKRPATTNSSTSSAAGPSRPSGKKVKMEKPDADR